MAVGSVCSADIRAIHNWGVDGHTGPLTNHDWYIQGVGGNIDWKKISYTTGSTTFSLESKTSYVIGGQPTVLSYDQPYRMRLGYDDGTLIPGESGIGPFTLYPSPPEIEPIKPVNPTCKGQRGSVIIKHKNKPEEVFVYNITKYTPYENQDCQNGSTSPILFAGSTIEYCPDGAAYNAQNVDMDQNFELNADVIISEGNADVTKVLKAGYYILKIESYQNVAGIKMGTCRIDSSYFEIKDPTYPILTDDNIELEQTSPSCIGNNDGSVKINSINVAAPPEKSFTWKKQGETDDQYRNSNVPIGGYTGGETYYVDVYNGCEIFQKEFTILASSEVYLPYFSKLHPECDEGGSITVEGNTFSNTQGYTVSYALNGGSYGPMRTIPSLVPSDEYILSMKINDLCESSVNGIVINDVPIAKVEEVRPIPPTCYNGDGSIEFTVSKPNVNDKVSTISYSYTISNCGLPDCTGTYAGNHTVVNIPRGLHTVIVTDECTSTEIYNDDVTVSNITALDISDNISDVEINCFDGTYDEGLTYTVSGGTTPYTFVLTRVELDEQVTNEDFSTSINTTTTTLSNLPRGEYELVVTDNCGYIDETSFKVLVKNADEVNGAITYEATIPHLGLDPLYDLVCTGDSTDVTIDVSGGNPDTTDPLDQYYDVVLHKVGEAGFSISSMLVSDNYAPCGNTCFTFKNLEAGIYYPVITDENGCEKSFSTETFEITEPAAVLTIADIDPADFGTNEIKLYTGDNQLYAQCHDKPFIFNPIVSTITGGITDYTFYMNEIEFEDSESFSWPEGTTDTTNVFKVADANGCVRSKDFTIQNPTEFKFEKFYDNETTLDHGASVECSTDLGHVYTEVSGGLTDYIYHIDDGITSNIETASLTNTFSGLSINPETGTDYTVTVTDGIGCLIASTINLTLPDPVVITMIDFDTLPGGVQIACTGGVASVAFKVSGGDFTGLYTLNWENILDGTTGIFSTTTTYHDSLSIDLLAGSYEVYFTDEYSCQSSPLETFILTEPVGSIDITSYLVTPPNCIVDQDGDEDLGKINATATGGTGPAGFAYTFYLMDQSKQKLDSLTSSDGNAAFDAPANYYETVDYYIRVIDVNGCLDDQLVQMIPDPTPLTVTRTDFTAPSCYDGRNGSMQFEVDEGNALTGGGFDYVLSGGHLGAGSETIHVEEATFTIDGLHDTNVDGVYHIYVIDRYGCDESQDEDEIGNYIRGLLLQAPDQLTLANVGIIRPSFRYEDDGLIAVQASGGTGSDPSGYYEFSLEESSGFASSVLLDPTYWVFNTAESESYTVYLRDNQYIEEEQDVCQTSVELIVPEGRVISLSDSEVTDISCYGEEDGSIQPVFTVDGLSENAHYDNLQMTWGKMDGSNNGEVIIDIDADAIVPVSNLNSGNYRLDASYLYQESHYFSDFDYTHEQSAQDAIHTNKEITQPPALYIQALEMIDASCGSDGDGKIVFEIMGGFPAEAKYYSIDGGANINILGSQTVVLRGLNQGTHHIDFGVMNSDCSGSYDFQIQEQGLSLEIEEVKKPCIGENNGWFRISANQEDLEYTINGEAWVANGGLFTNLSPGTYSVQARKTGIHGCQSDMLEVTLNENEMVTEKDYEDCSSTLLEVAYSVSPATCANARDGKVFINANNGVQPYFFSFEGKEVNPDTLSFAGGSYNLLVRDATDTQETVLFDIPVLDPIEVQVIQSKETCEGSCDATVDLLIKGGSGTYLVIWDGDDEVHGESRTGLCSQEYHYQVFDDANISSCIYSGSVIIEAYPSLNLSLKQQVEPTCADGSDGILEVAVSGGLGAYSYDWSSGSKLAKITGTPGEYQIEVKDDLLGCTKTESYTLPNRAVIVPKEVMVTAPRCFGSATGSIELVIESGVSPLIRWDHDARVIGSQVSNLSAGIYGYQIQSAQGCVSTGQVTIEEREPLTVNTSKQDVWCAGGCTGQIDIGISGGIAPYTVAWSHGSTSIKPKNLCAGSYRYTVTDAYGCQVSASIEISQPDPIQISSMVTDVSCYGGLDGEVDLTVVGGTGDYAYAWSNGSTGSDISGLSAKSYVVQVTDEAGCSATANYHILQPNPLAVISAVRDNPSCTGYADGSLDISLYGGVAPYTVEWNNGMTGTHIKDLKAGLYAVSITDAKGCTLQREWRLTDPSGLQFANVNFTDPICYDGSNGTISFIVIGGGGTYTYDWGNIEGSNEVNNLQSGNYTVTAYDQEGCSISEEFTLDNPDKPVVLGIEDYYILCLGGQLYLEPIGEWGSYTWSSTEGYQSKERIAVVEDEAEYLLVVTDDNNCPGETETYVEVSENPIDPDFIRISEAVVFDPIIFVDLSLPTPEAVNWLIPEDESIVINDMGPGSMELVFTEPGEFEIGIEVGLGECFAEIFKVVSVEATNAGEVSESARIIDPLEVQISPNPTSDEIKIVFNAPNENPIEVQLISGDQKPLRTEMLEGKKDYFVKWNLNNVPTGVYFLLFTQGGQVHSKRILVLK
ncbi:T9SS type A sorting domain-containing protein [Reichenbachiella agarivorans]|uniref:T9SS type A sorting domain-containing protein n=1 Tax=Reichenbachiella agarivorans TaxID=2979464 RepID=A0ABY6CT28_9BACT|nr:T9SS type A sorting domain-containing protein [Reichenbachiella agarivorans]UXP33661.1 T9SS type A sorting domain-containing protein [Reichenbachiella agarivorans]